MTERPHVSNALKEVWEWKDACYQEVAHLPRREALQALLVNAERTARSLNLRLTPMSSVRAMQVAEAHEKYGEAKKSQ